MGWLYILLICLFICILGVHFIESSWRDIICIGITSGICLTITIIIILSAIGFLFSGKFIKTEEKKIYDIQGLENYITTEEQTDGIFVLGFEYIHSEKNEKMKYYYFKVNDIGKKIECTDTDVYIRETDEINPCLIQRVDIYASNKILKWLFGYEKEESVITDTILVVPTNTIKINYNVEF